MLMSFVPDLGAFLIASILLILSPGPGTLSILGAATRSRGAGFAALAGTSLGDAILIVAATFGAAAILATNPTAFQVLKYAGAAYLVWLGIQAARAPAEALSVTAPAAGAAFRRSLGVTLLNPKAIVFFMAFFPQFIAPGAPLTVFALLGALFIALNCLYQAVLITCADWMLSHLSEAPRAAQWVNRALGAVFIFFGLRLAWG
jgi:leucine efflux protein